MEEVKSRPGSPGNRSQAAADKLCALREKANQALDEHRRRLGQIELELSERIKQLTEDFETTAANALLPDPSRDQEIESLRRQIEEGQARHEKFVAQLTAARKQLDEIQNRPCPSCEEAATQLVDAQSEARQLREKLAAAERQLEDDRAGKDKFNEQITAARKAISELTAKSEQDAVQLRKEIESALVAQGQAEERSVAIGHDFELLNSECEAAQAQVAGLKEQLSTALAEKKRLEQATTELDGERDRIVRERDKLAGERNELLRERDELAGERDKLKRDGEERDRGLQAKEEELKSLKAGASDASAKNASILAQAQKEASDLRTRVAELEAAAKSQEATLTASTDSCVKLQADLSETQHKTRAAEEKVAETTAQLGEVRGELEKLKAAKLADKARAVELEATVVRLQSDVSELRESTRPRAEFDELQEELTTANAEVLRLTAEVGSLQDALASRPEPSTADSPQLLAARAQCEALAAQLTGAEQARAQLVSRQTDLDQLAASLDRAEEELAQIKSATCPRMELEELQRKFDLALADAHKLKRENSGLREELASRPEANDEELPELVSIRAERDELSLRVSELEHAAAAVSETGAHRDLEDLQRRFEMAVDDVRQLKQENAQLRQQAAASPVKAPAPAGGGPQDWAAQKAKLLAMLEEEDQDGLSDSARQKERATIERTITATDRALEQKSQELEQLRAAFESHGVREKAASDASQRDEILDADAVIAAERERLSALQAEWEEKVRTAELEFAVERATLAREQASLKEQLFLLQIAAPKGGDEDGSTKPRRRWLSALGLGEENDESGTGKKK